MKKVLIVLLSLLTLSVAAMTLASFYMLDNVKRSNKEIEKNISKMNAVLIHEEILMNNHDTLEAELKVSTKEKFEELNIWKKAENKLNDALK